jgi:hypothetical protein
VIENDHVLFDMLTNKLLVKDSLVQISHCHPIGWFLAIDKVVDVFIGVRYHSIIFALEEVNRCSAFLTKEK